MLLDILLEVMISFFSAIYSFRLNNTQNVNIFVFNLVTVGDAHYESVDKSEQFAKQKAAYKAISNLSDGVYNITFTHLY